MTAARNSRILRVIPSMLLAVMCCPFACGKTIYVNDDAAGANDGSSWANAYNYLRDALMVASAGDEIWVAQGVYKPDQFVLSKRPNLGRAETFQLKNGVAIRGGYAGLGQPDPNARDVEPYETTLSGDLNGDDLPVSDLRTLRSEPTRAENSYNVVTSNGTDDTAVLDGFTITGGNADGPSPYDRGAGMYNDSGSPTLTNCIVSGNSADWDGGGMYNKGNSNPNLINCRFNGNLALWDGGGMYNWESRPTLTNCTFSGNKARSGGGMKNFFNGSPVLSKCMFSGNSARSGAAIHNLWDCDPTLTDCIFSRNLAEEDGGGIFNEENSNPNVMNCTFNENVAYDGKGGGMCNLNLCSPTIFNCTFNKNSANTGGGVSTTFKSNPILTNCTFTGNRANGGGGMGNLWDSSPTLNNSAFSGNVAVYEGGGMYNSESSATLNNCTFVGNSAVDVGGVYNSWDGGSTLCNCILWSNTLAQVTGNTAMSYSDVQGGWLGVGNIDADPLFADAGRWADVSDPNIVVEPDDPNAVWVDGDYHLKSQAGRWDPVSESWVIDDVTSPCIDAGDPNSPVGDEPEPNGGRINMGAYGGTAEASKSYSPWWFATTAGPVVAEGLGIVLPHEHIFTDLRGPTAPGYGQADPADVVRVMAPLLADAHRKGVGVLFECSSIGVGRNVSVIAQVAEASGLPVVVPTGVYGRANFAPPEHQSMTEDELTALFIAEIRDGIEGTGIKAGFIKIATGSGPMTALEEKFLRAAGRAARETGAAIASHTTMGSNAVRQADILQSISPAIRFIWVHAQNESNRSLHRQLAARGVFIELDSLGWNPNQDPTFIAAIKELLAAGYADRILLSHDAGWYQPGQPNGGTQKPYAYLIDAFIRKLRGAGVDDATIRMITETNPIRAFGFKSG